MIQNSKDELMFRDEERRPNNTHQPPIIGSELIKRFAGLVELPKNINIYLYPQNCEFHSEDRSTTQLAGSDIITATHGGQAIGCVKRSTIKGGSHIYKSSSNTRYNDEQYRTEIDIDYEHVATELNCFRITLREQSIPDFDRDKVICSLLAAEDAANGKNTSAIMKCLAKLKPVSSTILELLPDESDLRGLISKAIE